MFEPSSEEVARWRQDFPGPAEPEQMKPEPWEPGPDFEKPEPTPWPELPPAARHGLAGEFVKIVEPHTEADPVALLAQFLVMAGNVIGRGSYFTVEADRHPLNLFALLVGETAKGRKGTSFGHARRVFQAVDETWSRDRILHGLSSGEGLVYQVRDPIEETKPVREKGRATGEYETTIVDQGIPDKRLLVVEAEFARTLKVMGRDTNTLSAIIRQCWDTGDLRVLTKSSPARATGAHVSIIGHVTRDELLRYMNTTEAGNGFANRFLFACVRRSKCLPEGGHLDPAALDTLRVKLTRVIEFARTAGELRKDEAARKAWAAVYPDLSEGKPGLLGAVIARAEAQVMRLACLYSVLDMSPVIRVEHLKAALALWSYCETSARYIFGDAMGDPVADEILRVLKANPDGMTRTDISNHFGRHKSSTLLARTLASLETQGRIYRERVEDGPGRPFDIFGPAKKANYAKNPPLNSLNSLNSHHEQEGE